MDALEILRQSHMEAKTEFGKIMSASADQRGGMWSALRPKLEMHEQVEERHVYDPMVKDMGSSDSQVQQWHTKHEHEVEELKHMLEMIGGMDAHDQGWLDSIQQLHHTLEQHIEFEEHEFWPHIRSKWGADKLEDAGRMVQDAMGAGGTDRGRHEAAA